MRRPAPSLAFLLLAAPALAQQPLQVKTEKANLVVETVARGVENPWGLAFLPDGRMLVTERPGRLRMVSAKGELSQPLAGLPKVFARGQGGLLDVVPDPNFADNRMIYLSFAEDRGNGRAGTSVARAKVDAAGTALQDLQVIFRQEPSYTGPNHWGSRLVFDRSGALFVTLGERFDLRDEAQNPQNHIGKIVRIKPMGGAADDNPRKPGWAAEVWSIGHRNVQGAVLNPATGELWTAEHGARGGDEINIPRKGLNYGWPVISYGVHYSGAKIGVGTHKGGMEQPVYLLGSVDRALRHGLLHRRQVPGLARQRARRCARRLARLPARARRRQGRARGAHPARAARAHPRRAPGAGRVRLSADGFVRGTNPAGEAGRGAELTGAVERDDFSSSRHPALPLCLSMIFTENR